MNSNKMHYWLRRSAFTLVELLVVIVIIGVLLGLLLPSMRVSSDAARRMACSNNFKQLGLAMHNYHSAYKQLPMAMGGTDGGSKWQSNQGRLSGVVALLPFLEQQALWETIQDPSHVPAKSSARSFPPMGPAPWVGEYAPWRTDVTVFLCPSSPSTAKDFAQTNFALCIGDRAREIHRPESRRGFFECGQVVTFRQILDGLSNTIAMTEIGTPVDNSLPGQYAVQQHVVVLNDPDQCNQLRDEARPAFYAQEVALAIIGRGGRWCDGSAGFTLANTILPPNSASCAIDGETAVDGIYSAGSYHTGGCHVLMGDGAVKFTTESIEAGDSHSATLTASELAAHSASPYGLWGALGTAAANDDSNDQMDF